MSHPRYAALFSLFLAACTTPRPPPETVSPSPGAAKPIEDWRREALAQQSSLTKGATDEMSVNQAGTLTDILERPDPRAVLGPELSILPATGDALAWPAPREGVLTVRYRIEAHDCRAGGSDMGCHLVALCPDETSTSSAPVATVVSPLNLQTPTLAGLTVEVLEVPSPRCELRLYARDHHHSVVCTSRGPKLAATWSGAAVLDVGTITITTKGTSCEVDELAERMLFRSALAREWKQRNKQAPRP